MRFWFSQSHKDDDKVQESCEHVDIVEGVRGHVICHAVAHHDDKLEEQEVAVEANDEKAYEASNDLLSFAKVVDPSGCEYCVEDDCEDEIEYVGDETPQLDLSNVFVLENFDQSHH